MTIALDHKSGTVPLANDSDERVALRLGLATHIARLDHGNFTRETEPLGVSRSHGEAID